MDDVIALVMFGVAFAVTVVVVVFNCVCAEENKKGGQNGREDNLNNNRGKREATAVHVDESIESNSDSKTRLTRTQRELPQIPGSAGDINGLYAPVEDTPRLSPFANGGVVNNSESSQPIASGSSLDSRNRTLQEGSGHDLQELGSMFESGTSRSIEHPYDKIFECQSFEDRDTDTDTYDENGIYSTPENVCRLPRSAQANYEVTPPVPEKRYDREEPSTAAASAIAGRSSASDIDFMTPPPINSEDTSEQGLYPSYSSITVREPLAHLQAGMAAAAPANRDAPIQESQYWSVQDGDDQDGEQTYEVIPSAQNSTNSSETYSRIDQPTIQEPPSLVPPAPPTVASLRSVAHSQAHSRNASSSSFSSYTEYPHSPTSDRSSGSGSVAAAAPLGVSDLYSTVDKSKKKHASVHVMEGVQEGGLSLDSLYAKVQKGHSQSVRAKQVFNPSKSSSLGGARLDAMGSKPTRDPALLAAKIAEVDARMVAGATIVDSPPAIRLRRNSSTEDPRYEKINDDRRSTRLDTSVQRRQGAAKLQDGDDTSDVGYETVKLTRESSEKVAGYETILGDVYNYEEIEPNYEMVKNTGRRGGNGDYEMDSGDPGYESIVRKADPGYESVRYDTKVVAAGHGEESDVNGVTIEPRYWLIDGHQSRQREDVDDPFYERISSRDDDLTDPNYEKVKTASELSSESSEPGYESVKKPNSVKQEDGYAKVQERIRSHDNSTAGPSGVSTVYHGYEKLNKPVSPGLPSDGKAHSVGLAHQHTDNAASDVYASATTLNNSVGALMPDANSPLQHPSSVRLDLESSNQNIVIATCHSTVATSAHGYKEQSYNQKILEDSLQDDVLL